VVIENQGTVAEDVTVKVYYDYDPAVSDPIETKTVSGLAVGTSRSINFTWNTVNHLTKTYTITGLVDELFGETDTDDNTLRSDERVTVLLDAVYIGPNGSIDPPTAPISTVDNITYTLTANIYDSIVVERDNIVVDGAGYTVQGTGAANSKGIYLSGRSNITIKNMEIKTYDYGIFLDGSFNNNISRNNITNIHTSIHHEGTGIWLYESTSNSISGNNIINNQNGICLTYSESNIIYDNMIISNDWNGILLKYYSNHNMISSNTILNNRNGIIIAANSTNNHMLNNYIADCEWDGVYLVGSQNNSVISNTVNNCFTGIYMRSINDNMNVIYHNNFLDNTYQVTCYSTPNMWDDDYPSGGNYWSDYTDVDLYSGPYQNETGSDGIGDTPYIIYGTNQDNYPLMEPWSLKPSSPVEATQELIETIKTWNLSKGAENSLISKLDNAIHQLNKGNENVAINKLTVLMSQIEALRDKKLTSNQADYLLAEAQRIIDLINE
jgi:parallel beta-helix repeat protein